MKSYLSAVAITLLGIGAVITGFLVAMHGLETEGPENRGLTVVCALVGVFIAKFGVKCLKYRYECLQEELEKENSEKK